jgi:hypothetical protein
LRTTKRVMRWRHITKHVRLSRVTIRPEDDALAHCSHVNILTGRDIENDNSDGNQARAERIVQILLAGHAAERRCRWTRGMGHPRGSGDDYHIAIGR